MSNLNLTLCTFSVTSSVAGLFLTLVASLTNIVIIDFQLCNYILYLLWYTWISFIIEFIFLFLFIYNEKTYNCSHITHHMMRGYKA